MLEEKNGLEGGAIRPTMILAAKAARIPGE
jgi:hypothetical protein